MDGNNRWASKNNKDKYFSYNKGMRTLLNLSNHIFNYHNVNYISAFALSSKNLNRSRSFYQLTIKLINNFIDYINNNEINFSIKFIGDLSFLPKKTVKSLNIIESQKSNYSKVLYLFINYSGREDIIQASAKIKNTKFNNYNFHNFLLTKELIDPEILIRTGGFKRISDFMLFQLSFTELFFIKSLWPDTTKKQIDTILNKYYKIERKFGI